MPWQKCLWPGCWHGSQSGNIKIIFYNSNCIIIVKPLLRITPKRSQSVIFSGQGVSSFYVDHWVWTYSMGFRVRYESSLFCLPSLFLFQRLLLLKTGSDTGGFDSSKDRETRTEDDDVTWVGFSTRVSAVEGTATLIEATWDTIVTTFGRDSSTRSNRDWISVCDLESSYCDLES